MTEAFSPVPELLMGPVGGLGWVVATTETLFGFLV